MKSILALLVILVAGYMLFDGARALIDGDYVRPRSGPHAGQLGPWASLVRATGIDPESKGMKWVFVTYGFAWLVLLGFYFAGAPWGPAALALAAIGALWYAPFGTLLGLGQLVLLWFTRRT